MADQEFAIQYTNIYFILLVLITLFSFVLNPRKQKKDLKTTFFLFAFCALYIGLRPFSSVYTDMLSYKIIFEDAIQGYSIDAISGDFLFVEYTQLSARIMSLEMWFFLTALIYTWAAYKTLRNIFGNNMYAAFLLLVTSFFFFAYGTNTIRTGLAGSLALLGISQYYKNKKALLVLFFFLAINFHNTFIIFIIAFIISAIYKRTFVYIIVWLICFFLSAIIQLDISSYIIGLSGDSIQRAKTYLTGEDTLGIGGIFRWDFFLYGLLPIIWGLHIVWKKKFNDKFYTTVLNTYITINAAWILVIRMIYTDRFAYIGWILIPIVITYPLLKKPEIIKEPNKILSYAIIINLALTILLRLK